MSLGAEEGTGTLLLMRVLAGKALEAGSSSDQQPLAQSQAQQGPARATLVSPLVSSLSQQVGGAGWEGS